MEELLHDLRRAHREITETRLLLFTLCAAPILEIPLIMAALDTLDAANTSLDESLAALPGAVTASNAAADATAAKAASLAGEVAGLNTPAPTPTPTPTPTLTVNPATASFAAGVASSVALTIMGGVAPYTASGEPAGVTFDGANLNADTTTVAGSTTVTISDSSSPALTEIVDVVIA
jgi:hypothetical protein